VYRAHQNKPPLGACINQSHPLANGLQGAWLFNEAGGKVSTDLVARATLTAQSASDIAWDPATGAWNCKGFSDGCLLGGAFTGGDNPAAITVHVVAMPRSYPSSQGWMFAKGGSSGKTFLLASSGTYFIQGTSGTNFWAQAPALTLNQWSAVTAYLTPTIGATGASQMGVWVNGVDVTAARLGGSGSVTSDATQPWYVGGNDGSLFFTGEIALFYYWTRILTPAEIQTLYVTPFCFFGPPASPLAKLARFMRGVVVFTQTSAASGSSSPAAQRTAISTRGTVAAAATPGFGPRVAQLPRAASSSSAVSVSRALAKIISTTSGSTAAAARLVSRTVGSAFSSAIAAIVALLRPAPGGAPRRLPTIDCLPRKLIHGSTAEYDQAASETRRYEISLVGRDTIASASWFIAPAGPTLAPVAPMGGIASVLVSGLQTDTEYQLAVTAQGALQQTYQRSAQIACSEPGPSSFWEQGAGETRLYHATLNGDSVTGSAWSVAPSGPSALTQLPVGKTVGCLVSGLFQGQEYLLSAAITTAGGQVVKQTATLAGVKGMTPLPSSPLFDSGNGNFDSTGGSFDLGGA
jgi:hypothetical protein